MGKKGKDKPTSSGSVTNKSTIDLCENLAKCLLNYFGIHVPNFNIDADRIEKDILKILKRIDNTDSNSIPPNLTKSFKPEDFRYSNVIDEFKKLEFFITTPFDMIAAYANEECVKFALEKYNIPCSHLLNSDNGGSLVFWSTIYGSRMDETLREKYLNLIKIGLDYLKRNNIDIYKIPVRYSTSFLGFAVEYERDLKDADFAITKYLLAHFPNPPQNLVTELFKSHRDNNSLRLIFAKFQTPQNNTSVSYIETLDSYLSATKLLKVNLFQIERIKHDDKILSFYHSHMSFAATCLETNMLLSENLMDAINCLARHKATFQLYVLEIEKNEEIFTDNNLSTKRSDFLVPYFNKLDWNVVFKRNGKEIDCRGLATDSPQEAINNLFRNIFFKFLYTILSNPNNPSAPVDRMVQEARDYAKITIKLLKDKKKYERVVNNAYIIYSLCKNYQFIFSTRSKDHDRSEKLKIKLLITLESLFKNTTIEANPRMLKILLEFSIGNLAEYCTKSKKWQDLTRLFIILKNAQDITCLTEKGSFKLRPEKEVALKLPPKCLEQLTSSANQYIQHLDKAKNLIEANNFQDLLRSLDISLSETPLENNKKHLDKLCTFLGISFNNGFKTESNGNDLTVEVRYNPDTHAPSKFDEENKLGITINKDTQTFVIRDVYEHHINEFERFFNAWQNASRVSPESLEAHLQNPDDDVLARLARLELDRGSAIYSTKPSIQLKPTNTEATKTTSHTTTELMAIQRQEEERNQKIIEAIKQIVPTGYDHLTMVETPDIPNLFCRNFYVIHDDVYPNKGLPTRTEYTFGNHTIPTINQIDSKGGNENGAKIIVKDGTEYIKLKHFSLGDDRLISSQKKLTIELDDGIGEASLYLVDKIFNHAQVKRKFQPR